MKKIICTVINDLSFDQRMIRICRSLTAAGYDVELIGRELKTSKPLAPRAWKQTRMRCFWNKGKLFYLEYNLRLLVLLFFREVSVIHAVDLDTLLPAYLKSRLSRAKLIYDAHEIFTEVPELIERPNTRRMWLLLERKLLPRIQYGITVGKQLSRYYQDTYGIVMQVVRNAPVHLNTITNNPDPDRFFLYQGALNKSRGLEQMIDAMQFVHAKFIIAGEGDLSNELRDRVKHLNLEHKVHFTGYLSPDELRNLTMRAWAGINVSEPAGLSYYLSLNNKCFDYMHAHLPAIANPFPEYIELNEQFETMIFAQAQVEQLVEACQRMLKEKGLRKRLADNCKLASAQFNWQHEEKQLLKVYENII